MKELKDYSKEQLQEEINNRYEEDEEKELEDICKENQLFEVGLTQTVLVLAKNQKAAEKMVSNEITSGFVSDWFDEGKYKIAGSREFKSIKDVPQNRRRNHPLADIDVLEFDIDPEFFFKNKGKKNGKAS